MSMIRFEIDWCDPIHVDIPADASLAELAIWVGDDCITQNLTVGTRSRREAFEGVFGNLAGIADWFIENWVFLQHESLTPFPKSAFIDGGSDHTVPGLREAELGWVNSIAAGVPLRTLADWQHRHTIGHATSELAIPSIVAFPESSELIVAIDSPAKRLNSNTRFIDSLQKPRKHTTHVVRKVDFLSAVSNFIDEVLERLAKSEEASQLAGWMQENWLEAKNHSQNPVVIARTQFGELASHALVRLESNNSPLALLVKDTLSDCPIIDSQDEFDSLAKIVDTLRAKPNGVKALDPTEWSGATADGLDYQQGYRLAQVVRGNFQLGTRPIKEMVSVLNRGGLAMEPEVGTTLFRCLAVPHSDGTRSMVVSSTDSRASTPNGHRFALAATFGRTVWDQAIGLSRSRALAHGDFARISCSRRANAFAAELLLPREVFQLRLGNTATHVQIQELAEEFGMASSAAIWHARNHGVKVAAG